MFSSIIIMTWLNHCKLFSLLYYADTKETVFVWFRFFNLFKLFPALICANNIGSLVNNLFGVKIFNPFSSFTSSLPYSGGMWNKSTDSSLAFDSSFFDHTL